MQSIVDTLRLFAIGVGSLDLGMTIAVFKLYFMANRLNEITRQQELGRFTGALPRHIIAISLAHALMIVGIMGVIYARLGDEFKPWPLLIALPAFTLSLFGQGEMLRFQKHRIRLATGAVMVTGRPGSDR